MKYENFKTVTALVEKIDRHYRDLKSLQSKSVTVIINENEINGRIMTIGATGTYEHPYSKKAESFIDDLKMDLLTKISQLKKELAEL
jgi:hypothetical protein